ncbi:SARP family transcriptional regulator [Actinoplanes sp. NBRC 103695]|nr:SARP family transcriptional regulator [Actinoplanes sp. NBRC 103695]
MVVDDDGAELVVPRRMQRLLLAMLLLHSNTRVATDTIIGTLWRDRPPASAYANIQSHISVLRGLLGDRERLATRPGGYLLRTSGDEVDVVRFEELAARGRRELAGGQPAVALRHLTEAKDLWRGHVLEDIEVPGLLWPHVTRLEEQRLAVVEDHVEALLTCGRAADAIAELTALVERYPLRERFTEQLIRAMHRSGRPAEALEVYQRLRDVLGAELGVEPGARLRRLHRALISGEPDETARPGQWPVCQLPPRVADFVGHDEDLRGVVDLLTAGGIVVVSGTPGVGKTAFAVEVSHRLRERFPDGQLYVSLEGRHDCDHVLGELLTSLGVQVTALPHGPRARAVAFRALVADRRVLVVVDAARVAEQVELFLPGTGHSAVLVTSRSMVGDLPGAHHVRLAPLRGADAVTLMARMIPDGRVRGRLDAAHEIVELCGGLPLALRVVGARLRPQPATSLERMADRLRDGQRRLDELAYDGLQVRSVLEIAVSELPPDLEVAFRRMALLSDDFAAWTLGVLTNGSDGERLVERLVAYGLLDPVGVDATGEPRYRPHALVALFVAELAQRHDDSAGAIGDLLDALTAMAAAVHGRVIRASEGLPPQPGPIPQHPDCARLTRDAQAWLRVERHRLLDVIGQACRIGLYERAARLADLTIPALDQLGLDDLRLTLRTIFDAASAAGDEVVAWRAEYCRADLLVADDLAAAASAYLACADAFRRLDRPRELVYSITGLAFVNGLRGIDPAAQVAEAREVARGCDPLTEALALRTHAETSFMAGRPGEALELLTHALELAREPGEMRRLVLMRTADCAIALGDLARAHEAVDEAFSLVDTANNPRGVAWVIVLRNRVRLAEGRPDPVIGDAVRARELSVKSGDARGVAVATMQLGEAYLRSGAPDRAAGLLVECLEMFEVTGVRYWRAHTERLLAEARQSPAYR